MISHGKEIKVFTGNSNPELAHAICAQLYQNLGSSTVSQFADGECSISVFEPVRGKDVFIVQSTCGPVNDNLMELLIMIDAMRRASAGRITAVIPYFGYARQDRKAKSRDPISAKLVANLITAAGADRVLTMDLHAAQIQGFFDIPVDNLMGAHLFSKHYVKMFGKGNENLMVVSPDVGSTARARAFSMKLGVNMAIVDKRREKANQSEVMNIIGNVEGTGVFAGAADVVVTDGFTGNVLLKSTEGVIKYMMKQLKGVFYKNTANKLAAAVLKKDLGVMKKSMDVNEVGGTAMIGISKPVIKAHGSSNAACIFSAMRQAQSFAESGIISDIEANIEYMKLRTEAKAE